MKVFLQPVKLPSGIAPEIKEFPQGRSSVLLGSSADCNIRISHDAIEPEHLTFLRLPSERNLWNVISLYTCRGVDITAPDDTKIELKPHEPVKIESGYNINFADDLGYVLLDESFALPKGHQMYPTLNPSDEAEISRLPSSIGVSIKTAPPTQKRFLLVKTFVNPESPTPDELQTFLIGSPEVVLKNGESLNIGRAMPNVNDSDYRYVSDKFINVSRTHCSFSYNNGELSIKKLKPECSVLVNGQNIGTGKKILKHNDSIALSAKCKFTIYFLN